MLRQSGSCDTRYTNSDLVAKIYLDGQKRVIPYKYADLRLFHDFHSFRRHRKAAENIDFIIEKDRYEFRKCENYVGGGPFLLVNKRRKNNGLWFWYGRYGSGTI